MCAAASSVYAVNHHSQMLFSLFICIALFSQSLFGLPFAVLGFWKMGFPETAGHYQCALCIGKVCELLIAAQSRCCSSCSADVMCRSASPRCLRTLMGLAHHCITRQVILPCFNLEDVHIAFCACKPGACKHACMRACVHACVRKCARVRRIFDLHLCDTPGAT